MWKRDEQRELKKDEAKEEEKQRERKTHKNYVRPCVVKIKY